MFVHHRRESRGSRGLLHAPLPTLATLVLLASLLASPPAGAAVTLIGPWAEAQDGAIRISWQTATELDHVGFLVQRGSSADGPFERIDDSWRPARGIGQGGADYEWLDRAVQSGRDYHYRIEAIDNRNHSEYFGPVCARLGAAACLSASPEAVASPSPRPSDPPAHSQSPTPAPASSPPPPTRANDAPTDPEDDEPEDEEPPQAPRSTPASSLRPAGTPRTIVTAVPPASGRGASPSAGQPGPAAGAASPPRAHSDPSSTIDQAPRAAEDPNPLDAAPPSHDAAPTDSNRSPSGDASAPANPDTPRLAAGDALPDTSAGPAPSSARAPSTADQPGFPARLPLLLAMGLAFILLGRRVVGSLENSRRAG